jgi:hypothetical protein
MSKNAMGTRACFAYAPPFAYMLHKSKSAFWVSKRQICGFLTLSATWVMQLARVDGSAMETQGAMSLVSTASRKDSLSSSDTPDGTVKFAGWLPEGGVGTMAGGCAG